MTQEQRDLTRNALRKYGVNTDDCPRGGARLGLYYVEKGASQRPSKVIYDRAGSAIALAEPKDFDWDTIFEGASWFHWTGITPALGGKLPQICLEACQAALEYAERELEVPRKEIRCHIAPDNAASRKLAEKLGITICFG